MEEERYIAVPYKVLESLVNDPYYTEEFAEACAEAEKLLSDARKS
jgi:hypothetical protein